MGPVNTQLALIGTPGGSSGLEEVLRTALLWRMEEFLLFTQEFSLEKGS